MLTQVTVRPSFNGTLHSLTAYQSFESTLTHDAVGVVVLTELSAADVCRKKVEITLKTMTSTVSAIRNEVTTKCLSTQLRIISFLSKLENVIVSLFRSDDDGKSSAAMQ